MQALSALVLSLLALTAASRLNSDEMGASSKRQDFPYVTCDLRGGLGNQIFEIATTLAYAWDYGAIAIFPDLNRGDSNLSHHRDTIFFRLNSSYGSRPISKGYSEVCWHSGERIPFQSDQKLYGYLQSWVRFDRYRNKLLQVLAPSSSILGYLTEKYGDLIAHPNTVGIHVRTFSASLHASKLHPFAGMEYYQKAIAAFPPDTLFVVFSDRINWCKKHFPMLGRTFAFIEGNDEIQDFFLMSMMKHQIIPNSTFSWWAAYLNQNIEKTVIAPTSWQHPDLYPFPLVQPNEFYLPDWLLIAPDYNAPYPADMVDYDFKPPWDGN